MKKRAAVGVRVFLYRGGHTLEKWGTKGEADCHSTEKGELYVFLLMVSSVLAVEKAVHLCFVGEFVGQKHTLQMSFPKQDNPRGHSFGLRQPVGDEKDGRAIRQPEEQVFNGMGSCGIEGCRGFVEEQHFRLKRQRAGKAEALLLPP